jgi:3-dehydrosphinganine reductase
MLTKMGAHVSIVARDENKLRNAQQQLEVRGCRYLIHLPLLIRIVQSVRQTSEQILQSYSFSLNSAESSKAALEAACASHGGKAPDAVFTCAGSARPSFFIEQTEQLLVDGMTNAYWIQAWTALVNKKDARSSDY